MLASLRAGHMLRNVLQRLPIFRWGWCIVCLASGLASCSLLAPKDSELLGGLPSGGESGAAGRTSLTGGRQGMGGEAGQWEGEPGGTEAGSGGESGGPDIGGDAGTAGTAGTAPAACPPGAVFCDDFDQGELGATWDSANLQFAVLDAVRAHTAPASLRIQLPEQAPETSALLKQGLGTASESFRVSFYLRIAAARDVYPFGLFLPTDNYQISLHLDGLGHDELALAEQTSAKLANGESYAELATSASLPANGAWRHIELFFRRTAGTVSVRVDGAEALTETPLLGAALLKQGVPTLGIGVFFADSGASWDGGFDDVVVSDR